MEFQISLTSPSNSSYNSKVMNFRNLLRVGISSMSPPLHIIIKAMEKRNMLLGMQKLIKESGSQWK